MNAPLLDRSKLHVTLNVVGKRHGLRIVDLLPTGSVEHPTDPQPVIFLAEKGSDEFSLLDLCAAEVDLQERLGFAARILLRTELEGSATGRELLGQVRGL